MPRGDFISGRVFTAFVELVCEECWDSMLFELRPMQEYEFWYTAKREPTTVRD